MLFDLIKGVTVLAEDQGKPRLSALCFFFISIGDENDNSPRFDESEYKFTIAANHNMGSLVIQVCVNKFDFL